MDDKGNLMNLYKPVLTMYDVRGKQDFIFRTNKLKEIAGGSWIIRDCFADYLFPAAEKIVIKGENGEVIAHKGLFYYKEIPEASNQFTEEGFKKHIKEDRYIGEVVYDGGGNFLVLFLNKKIFQDVTYLFTKSLMENVGTLRVLGSCFEIEGFDNYKTDERRLREIHRKNEAEESIISPWSCLPFVQVDRQTSQPLIVPSPDEKLPNQLKDELEKQEKGELKEQKKYSRECLAKRKKFYEVIEAVKKNKVLSKAEEYFIQNENIFDKMVTEKGEDSLLAVVYIDGNSMGAKVQSCLEKANAKTYKDCVQELREFSNEIQKKYIEEGINAALQKEADEDSYRIVVCAGDEINFVVNAHDAWQCAKDYLQKLQELNEGDSACAGIAVFHSHAPYAEAYRVAEECCESGKKLMKEKGITDACFIDFHIIQGAVGIDLKSIRKDTKQLISRPWLLCLGKDEDGSKADGITTVADAERLAGVYRLLGRNNVKDLASIVARGSVDLSLDLLRIRAHLPEKKRDAMKEDWEWIFGQDDKENNNGIQNDKGTRAGRLIGDDMRKLIYDTVIAYDLWLKNEPEKKDSELPTDEKTLLSQ